MEEPGKIINMVLKKGNFEKKIFIVTLAFAFGLVSLWFFGYLHGSIAFDQLQIHIDNVPINVDTPIQFDMEDCPYAFPYISKLYINFNVDEHSNTDISISYYKYKDEYEGKYMNRINNCFATVGQSCSLEVPRYEEGKYLVVRADEVQKEEKEIKGKFFWRCEKQYNMALKWLKITPRITEAKMNIERKILTITVYTILIICIVIAIPTVIILILAKVGEEPATVFHSTVDEGGSTRLEFTTENCPKISYFYSNPSELNLYLKIFPDTLSKAGITLSFYTSRSSNDSNIYFGRLALCYASPGSQCSLLIPKHVLFYPIVTADSNLDGDIDTIIFRWECLYTMNDPLIVTTVLFTLCLYVIFTILTFLYFRKRIIGTITNCFENIHAFIRAAQNEEKVLKTPTELTIDEMFRTDTTIS
ncbi:hypothetical protein LOD99_14852 [Oopsacas minuta]|uniref:Transmembrane protein n=1 Tax=Oopsacas minuta TaxID=111878 RepID=A0AAV7KD88_9METZ|nr:hypothetical protein LOD99_14852 [Oopsacas minuta]